MPKYYIWDSEDESKIVIIDSSSPFSACIKAVENKLFTDITIKPNGHIKGYYVVNEKGFGHDLKKDLDSFHIPIKEVIQQCTKKKNKE